MSAEKTTISQRSFLSKIYIASITVIGSYLILYAWLQASEIKFLLLMILGSAFVIGYFVTTRTNHTVASAHYYIVCCYLTLFANAAITGGVGAPGIIWFLLCPLIAFLTLSTRFARIWLIVIIATVASLYAFRDLFVLETFENEKILYLVSYVLFFPMVYSIMKIFRIEVSKRNVELNTLNQRLKLEREHLQKTQQEILFQSEHIRQAESKALERSAKLSYYLDQLIEVKRMEEVHSGSLKYSIGAILQFLQKSMSLDSVALWNSQGDNKTLELFRYRGNESNVYERAILCRQDFVEAYDLLSSGAIVNGGDQLKEAEQLKTLFQYSAGNDSMINCPYFMEGEFSGFISCRASGRKWLQEDIIFVRAIADTVSLAFKSHFKVFQQKLLEEKQREIIEINASLEKKVQARTIALNKRNKQLTDFAFTNAHHIRGPICRLLGLQYLLSSTEDCKEVRKIAGYMSSSVKQLDVITKKTSEELNMMVDCAESI